MRKNLLENIDFETAKKVADEFPALSKREMDRMFSASMKKAKKISVEDDRREQIFASAMTKATSETFEDVEVLKIEKYKKPAISRYIGLAASLALVGAVIFGMGTLLCRTPEENDNPAIEPATQILTEQPTEARADKQDYEAAAYRITDEYFTLGRYIYAGGFEYKENNGLPPKESVVEISYMDGGELKIQEYYPVIDEKFPDMAALKAYYYSYRAEVYTVYGEITEDEKQLELTDTLFGGDITDEDMKSPETITEKLCSKDGTFYEYININGNLYMLQYPLIEGIEAISAMNWTNEPVISDVNENSFTVTRTFVSVEEILMAEVTVAFEMVWDEAAQDWRAASENITGKPIGQGD